MTQYRVFVISFITSVLALIVFLTQYFQFIIRIMTDATGFRQSFHMPADFLNLLLTPTLVVSAVVLGITTLVYRILGIVFIARKKSLPGGEQALWIIGFAMMGFITAIVFMAMAQSKQLTIEDKDEMKNASPY